MDDGNQKAPAAPPAEQAPADEQPPGPDAHSIAGQLAARLLGDSPAYRSIVALIQSSGMDGNPGLVVECLKLWMGGENQPW